MQEGCELNHEADVSLYDVWRGQLFGQLLYFFTAFTGAKWRVLALHYYGATVAV